jgi:hypothetical protein
MSRASYIAVAIAVLLGGTRPAAAIDTCFECHSKLQEKRLSNPARLYDGSVHHLDAVGCKGCHGGDEADSTAAAHDTGDFKGRPDHKSIPRLCGTCHADARVIRRFSARLPLDQLALYENSHHGQLVLWKDSERAPECSTCHGSHDIRPVTDPRSPVNRENVAELCGGCHAHPEKMGDSKLKKNQLSQWKTSAHGTLVLAGDLSAPSCPQCHGSHGATPPAVGAVSEVCGSCHLDEVAAFDKGPHPKAFAKLGFAECLPCHGSHEVQAARPLALGLDSSAACEKCHKGDDRPREVAAKLSTLVQQATDRAAAARATVLRAEREGLFVPGTEAAILEMTTAVERLRPALHSLDPKALEKPVDAVNTAADEAERIVTVARRNREIERRGYYVAVALIVALFLLLAAKGRQLGVWRRET